MATWGIDVNLLRANGDTTQYLSNQWPRWSPDHGAFQQRTVYWVAFSSRRGYGLRIAGGAVTGQIKPQLWFTAVRLTAGGTIEGDPSFAPVWLPGQNDSMTNRQPHAAMGSPSGAGDDLLTRGP